MSPLDPDLSLAQGMRLSHLTAYQLWLAYFAVGGDGDELEVEAYVCGALHPCAYQHNLIAQALNEHLIDADAGQRVAYQAFYHE